MGGSFEFHSCKEEDLTINGDKDQIQQALDNIMINAINQTLKDTRKIIAEVKILPTVVEIIISDNGVGIESANL